MRDTDSNPLSEEIEAFRESARDFVARQSAHERLRALRTQAPAIDRAVWRQIGEMGWGGMLVAEDDGGLGLGLPHACAVLEEVGRALLPEPVTGALMLPAAVLSHLPSTPSRDKLLAHAIEGHGVIGLAWQERDELEAECLTTRAERRGDVLILNGAKLRVVPGGAADKWLVTVDLASEGPAIVSVDARAAGLQYEHLKRVDASAMANLSFRDVQVSARDALVAVGQPVRAALAYGLETARVLQAAELLGTAEQAFEITREYLQTRVQFGKPIGANQALQHRMVDAYMQIALARAGLQVATLAASGDARAYAIAASRAKARCSEAALHIGRLAVQFHGAMGYTDECAVGLYLKRALHLASWLGNAPAHRQRFLELQTGEPDQAAAQPVAEGIGVPASVDPRGVDWSAMPDASFRALLRQFFREHYPENLRHVQHRLHWPEIRHWYMTLSREGWLAPAWPRRYGGMELPSDKLIAFIEEQEAYGVARMPDQGLINLGPLLIAHGSDEQKQYWLPRILSGENIWCQGYSEPNAGSDLASLRTQAVLDGDTFVVNGQKIWTTLAQDATHIFMLVRTGQFERPQQGISFLLAELSSPGVTVRPILNIAGEEEFCEVFFDNVRVPAANLVGAMHDGWRVAKSLLGHERIFIGSPKTAQYTMQQLLVLARGKGEFDDPVFRSRLSQLYLDLADLRSLYSEFAEYVKRGEELPPSVSLLKIWSSETYTRLGLLLMEAAGDDGGTYQSLNCGDAKVNPLLPLMSSLVTTIYGGTNEIQRNIVSRNVLHLPT